ncbi:MAG: selenocysteine-specific translation elongation factor [Deltaproteobacteria bacterium]|jgi:selenocysteine-specific elongation factor|nr:selenocysteine-specific translation elongation factor [Deltaproteobacteria bacterium]MCL5880306.1 selenocysteine-specific translation elongation factor [Deltaproteobacteria bacterium]MDA8303960.1 selenocysteine-specific translation elongation factor [Deltaproteobacteria bacterium]
MENFILGTAGHIDHGKSSLIKALTGVETDRLEEEKRRGISIVLGYANITLPSGISVGIVDVPGHAKFIKTMVSGSTGMDGVLLVIAADDGIMAQTKEHLLILKLLGIGLVIPVLTKIDTVNDEIISKRETLIKDFLKSYGYDKASQNIIKVSIKSGRGIFELKNAIEKAINARHAKDAAVPASTKVFLPIDRVISSKGFGTILAGTLKYGSFSVGDEIQVMPSGLTAKIKNMESHNKKVTGAHKSMRISLNVPSIKKESVKYGDIISSKDSLLATDSVFTKFYYDFDNKKELKSHLTLIFMTGSTSISSKVIILNENKKISPGNYSYAIFKLQNKISTMSKERFVVRDAGAGRTIGGGIIIDPFIDYRYDEPSEGVYKGMASDDPQEAVYSFIRLAGGADLEEIYKKLNFSYPDFTAFIDKLKGDGRIIADDKRKFAILKEDFDISRHILVKTIKENLENEKSALKSGIGKLELYHLFENNINKHYKHSEVLFDIILDDLLSKKEILNDNGYITIKSAGNEPAAFKIPEECLEVIKNIENLLKSSGNSVPTLDELEKKIKINKKMLNYAITVMAKQGELVKVKHDIYYLKEQIDNIKKGLDLFFQSSERLEPKDMKEIAAVSRKYAIPLLEYFDYAGYTVKTGDYRIKK